MNYRLLVFLVDALFFNVLFFIFKFLSSCNNFPYHFILIPLFLFILSKYYFRRLPLWIDIKETLKLIFISYVFSLVLSVHIHENIVWLTVIFLIGAILLPFYRYYARQIMFKMGMGRERVVIVGANALGIKTLKGFVDEKNLGYEVIGFVDNKIERNENFVSYKGHVYPLLGDMNYLLENIYDFTSIIIIENSIDKSKCESLIRDFQLSMKKIVFIPEITKIPMLNSELYYLFSDELFYIRIKNNLYRRISIFLKFIFNYVLGVIICLLISPFLFAIALVVKLTSQGPVIFAHPRIGKGGKEFNCYKFRSMYCDAKERLEVILKNDAQAKEEWETSFKLKNDPRVTGIGRFLRKTSLDELPQIFNVLKGEMALVGPRPVIQEELDKYYKDNASYYKMVAPGITGLWQVGGRSDVDYDYRVHLDTWYVLNWSIWLDIVILFKTVNVVVMRKGAY